MLLICANSLFLNIFVKAIKVVKWAKLKTSRNRVEVGSKYRRSLKRELAIIERLDHKSIVKVYSALPLRDGYAIVMQHAPHGDMMTHLVRRGLTCKFNPTHTHTHTHTHTQITLK